MAIFLPFLVIFITPHFLGHLFLVRSLPTIHTFHQSLRLFLKCKEGPFLRPLRSKDNQCWILRLWPRNFVIIFESLAANLEKADLCMTNGSKVLIYGRNIRLYLVCLKNNHLVNCKGFYLIFFHNLKISPLLAYSILLVC